MLTREVFCSIVFDLACVRRFAVAKPPYDLRTLFLLVVIPVVYFLINQKMPKEKLVEK